MDPVKISEDNLEEYSELLPPDIAENMSRDFYRGVALGGSDAGAAAVWELRDADGESADTTSEMKWLFQRDEESGQELLKSYRKAAAEEFVVRTFYEFPADAEGCRELLAAGGFSVEEKEGRDVVTTIGELNALAIAKGKVPSHVQGVGELTIRQYRRGIMDCLFHGHKGMLQDLAKLPMNYFDQEVSSCVFLDDKVNGFLLVHEMPSGPVFVNYMCAFEPEMRTNLALMIRRSIQKAAEKYPAETAVILRRYNEATKKLVEKLFPGKKGEMVIAGERKER
ncbi:MAG: hypothetical protein K6B72_13035 [Lachnospiraceae bacterium]|nr:hypothetical protein [Lachnospiraceae bacterium]